VPNRPSALKSLRQDEKRTLRNKRVESRLHTEQTKFARALQRGELEQARTQLNLITRLLQRAADHKIIHPNRAARLQAHCQQRLHRAQSAAPSA
jgi:small subunit ribosomal protein S20